MNARLLKIHVFINNTSGITRERITASCAKAKLQFAAGKGTDDELLILVIETVDLLGPSVDGRCPKSDLLLKHLNYCIENRLAAGKEQING